MITYFASRFSMYPKCPRVFHALYNGSYSLNHVPVRRFDYSISPPSIIREVRENPYPISSIDCDGQLIPLTLARTST